MARHLMRVTLEEVHTHRQDFDVWVDDEEGDIEELAEEEAEAMSSRYPAEDWDCVEEYRQMINLKEIACIGAA